MLEQEIKKLGYEIRLQDNGEYTIVVTIPEWDVEETAIVSDEDEKWHVASADQPGWGDFYPKKDWTFEEAIRDFFEPVDVDEEEEITGVKRDNNEVYELLKNLKAVHGADDLLEELSRVMSTDAMADALEDVADNWDISVNEDGTIYIY